MEGAWPGAGPVGGDGGRRLVTRLSRLGTLGLGRQESRGPLARQLVAWARNGSQAVPDEGRARTSEHGVPTACEPRGTDSDGAKLTACKVGVLRARVWVLTSD